MRSKTTRIHVVACRWHESVEAFLQTFRLFPFTLYDVKDQHVWMTFHGHLIVLDGTLPDVGRESYIYLNHIIRNYHDLTEWTLFTQADPLKHGHGELFDDPGKIDLSRGFSWLFDTHFECDGNGGPHHTDVPVKRVWETLFRGRPPARFDFVPGAIFVVHRNNIHARPRAFYEKMIGLVSKEKDPIEGYAVERLWGYVFNPEIE